MYVLYKPFKTVEYDKNVGFAIISHELNLKLCLENLNLMKLLMKEHKKKFGTR